MPLPGNDDYDVLRTEAYLDQAWKWAEDHMDQIKSLGTYGPVDHPFSEWTSLLAMRRYIVICALVWTEADYRRRKREASDAPTE